MSNFTATSRKITDLESYSPDSTPWDLVSELEDDLDAARLAAMAIARITEVMKDKDDAVVLQFLAYIIADHCMNAETRRGALFQMLHPNKKEKAE